MLYDDIFLLFLISSLIYLFVSEQIIHEIDDDDDDITSNISFSKALLFRFLLRFIQSLFFSNQTTTTKTKLQIYWQRTLFSISDMLVWFKYVVLVVEFVGKFLFYLQTHTQTHTLEILLSVITGLEKWEIRREIMLLLLFCYFYFIFLKKYKKNKWKKIMTQQYKIKLL